MFAYTASNILLHIVLLTVAIGGLFFIYTRLIEEKVITIQVDRLVDDMTSEIKVILTPDQRNSLKDVFSKLTPPNMRTEDEDAAKSNERLLKKASTVLGAVLIIGVLIVLVSSWLFSFSFVELLKENFVTLVVACCVEVVFISLFARNFRSLDPNMVKYNLVKAIQSYATEQSYNPKAANYW